MPSPLTSPAPLTESPRGQSCNVDFPHREALAAVPPLPVHARKRENSWKACH
jgi:hypothetical protein